MIGRITGIILHKNPDRVLVDVGGVGYEIEIPLTTYHELGDIDDQVTLHIHFIVREDAQLLYGFVTERERELFRTLIKVNSVGPRVALTIQGLESDSVVRLVRNNDVKSLTALPGVGKITADRIIFELKDKLSEWEVADEPLIETVQNRDNLDDAEAALIGLGYKPREVSLALAHLDDPTLGAADLIRQALRKLTDK